MVGSLLNYSEFDDLLKKKVIFVRVLYDGCHTYTPNTEVLYEKIIHINEFSGKQNGHPAIMITSQ